MIGIIDIVQCSLNHISVNQLHCTADNKVDAESNVAYQYEIPRSLKKPVD